MDKERIRVHFFGWCLKKCFGKLFSRFLLNNCVLCTHSLWTIVWAVLLCLKMPCRRSAFAETFWRQIAITWHQLALQSVSWSCWTSVLASTRVLFSFQRNFRLSLTKKGGIELLLKTWHRKSYWQKTIFGYCPWFFWVANALV